MSGSTINEAGGGVLSLVYTGPSAAQAIAYDDTLTALGSTTVQEAIVALYQLITAPTTALDLTNVGQLPLILSLGIL